MERLLGLAKDQLVDYCRDGDGMQKRRAQNERYIFGDGGKDTWYNGVTHVW